MYQDAVAFVAWWAQVSQKIPGRPAVKDQLDRASTSTPLNIAEGNGRHSLKERSHYFTIARGSALEGAACLDVLVAQRRLDVVEVEPGKRLLHGIVRMLHGLISAQSDRVAEEVLDHGYGLWERGDLGSDPRSPLGLADPATGPKQSI